MTIPLQELLDSIEEAKPRNIRQMLYHIVYLWVMRVEIRVEAKTKTVFRKVNRVPDAIRVEH